MPPAKVLKPKKSNWIHVGCPTCGYVETVPYTIGERLPWCPHNNQSVIWRAPRESTQRSARAWTQTVKVKVTVIGR